MGEPSLAQQQARHEFKTTTSQMFGRRYKRVIKVTPVQRDKIRERRINGECPKALALEYGISASYVRSLAPLS